MASHRLENHIRQSIFDDLAALFIRPDAAGVLGRWSEALEVTAALGEECGVECAELRRLAAKPLPSSATVEAEYERLFSPERTDTPIPLCEGAWEAGGREARARCRTAFLAAGLSLTDELGVPEDHLGMLLGFMAVLFLRDDPKAAETFFDEHLATWLPDLCRTLKSDPSANFFRDAAELLRTILFIEASLRVAK